MTEKGRMSAKEVSSVREAGAIPPGHDKEVQVEQDGERRVYFVRPDEIERGRSQVADMRKRNRMLSDSDDDEGRDPEDNIAVMALDENGIERGIPLSWCKE
jgi:hypothetical protein